MDANLVRFHSGMDTHGDYEPARADAHASSTTAARGERGTTLGGRA